MKTRLLLFALLAGLSAIAGSPAEEGKAIFTTRCAGCHNVNKVLTGPALAGIDERRSVEWIVEFVRSSQSLIKKGDKDALALFEKFNKIPMPDHPDLTADKIKSIIEYIKSETKANAPTEKAITSSPKKSNPATLISEVVKLLKMDTGFLITFSGLIALLITALILWLKTRSMVRNIKAKI